MSAAFTTLAALYFAAMPHDTSLDVHLAQWERATAKASSFSATFELTRTDAVFKKERKYAGSVLLMKPNLARISFSSATNKNDYELYIFDGKSIFEYDWANKVVTEIPVQPGENGITIELFRGIKITIPRFGTCGLDLLLGFQAAKAKERFQIEQFKGNDKNYIYFDISPTVGKDKQQFERMRVALYGPDVKPPYLPYMPVQLWLSKPNGDTEMWKFNAQRLDPKVDCKEIGPKAFQFEEPKGEGWTIRKASTEPTAPKP